MLLHRLQKKTTTAAAAELCVEAELLEFKTDTLTLEEKVTIYFEQWRDPVNRYVVAAFGNPVEAEEITQEAFLHLYRRLHSGQAVANVRAWLFRAAHSLAVSRIRSQQFIELLDEESWEQVRRSLVDATPNPEQRLLHFEKFSRLRGAIARLTAPERQCLHLRTKGLRYREIAEILNLGTSTIAETLYRVIDKLTQENNG
ncbi:MAG TPA: sigma-70 family RNA polymerase sigma factor [Pyrinomonadaceae bacterium]|nr:sigma-70 family RNA polymerase sigma factor [Pyrinomonadaceae bacterium]